MSNKVYSVIRVSLDGVDSHSKVRTLGSITRWVCSNYGRVFSSPDNGFIFTDVEPQKVSALCHIVNVGGGTTSIRLVTQAFFDKLFEGSLVDSINNNQPIAKAV